MVIFVVDWWFADTFGVCLEDFVIDWWFFIIIIVWGFVWWLLWLIGGLLTYLAFTWRVCGCLVFPPRCFGVCVVFFVVGWWFADAFGVCLVDFVIDWCFFNYYYCLGVCVVAFMVDW